MAILKKSFLTEVSFTFLSQVLITIFGIVLLKIFARDLSEEGMGAYLVIRRAIALTYPLITLNLSMSMARYISINQRKAEQYLVYSFFILTVLNGLALITLPLTQNLIAKIIFGDAKYSSLLFPTVIFLYANSFHILCIGYFRGKQKFLIMNIINILFWSGSLIVLTIKYFIFGNFVHFLYYYFVVYALLAFAMNWVMLLKYGEMELNLFPYIRNALKVNNYQNEKSFFQYGIFRLPTGFFLASLFFIPIVSASSSISLKTAAYIGIIVSILRMLQLLGYPFNLIFLPKFSSFQANDDHISIRKNSQIVVDYIFSFPLLVGVLMSFFAREVILLWFGAKYSVVVPYLMLLGPLIGLFLGYVLIRGILDGLTDFPYSNIITFLGMFAVGLVSLLTLLFSWNLLGLTMALNFGVLVLGISSLYILRKLNEIKIFHSKNLLAILWFVFISAVLGNFAFFVQIESILLSFVIKLTLSLIVVIFSFLYYKRLKFSWVDEVLLRLSD